MAKTALTSVVHVNHPDAQRPDTRRWKVVVTDIGSAAPQAVTDVIVIDVLPARGINDTLTNAVSEDAHP